MPTPTQSSVISHQSSVVRYWDTPFFVELLLLALTAPVLYFPGRFESQEIAVAIGILAAGWLWRRLTIGVWFRRTPADWPIFFLFLVMLPISVWAAPGPLRVEYSIPRALILIWNFFLFWTIVSHASRRQELFRLCVLGFGGIGVGIALASIFGTNWKTTISALQPIVERIPTPLAGLFADAESGFNANQVAGSLLYILPVVLALTLSAWRSHRWRTFLLGAAAIAPMLLMLGLSQSRSGYMGFALALVVVGLAPFRWGRWGLLVGGIGLLLILQFVPVDALLSVIADAPPVEAVGGVSTFGFRQIVWEAALYGISDFSFTGMGLGTFRKISFLLYPMVNISPTYDIAHAHNFFLQSALDFGLPGLIALLVLYGLAFYQVFRLLTAGARRESLSWLSIGLLAALLGQSAYSFLDSVSMGSKPNLILWVLLALIFATATVPRKQRVDTDFYDLDVSSQ